MSTRSYIGIENKDGTIEYVYCHYDGYLSGVGSTLLENYIAEEEVRELIGGGDLSQLGGGVKQSTYYARDRGEDFPSVMPAQEPNRKTFATDAKGEYLYLFSTAFGSWAVLQPGSHIWVGVRRALKQNKA